MARHPWKFPTAGTLLLAVCAVPPFSMRLGHVDDGADRSGSTTRKAYDWIAEGEGPGFGPGANGPFVLVADLHHAAVPADRIAAELTSALRDTAGIACGPGRDRGAAGAGAVGDVPDGPGQLVAAAVPGPGPATAGHRRPAGAVAGTGRGYSHSHSRGHEQRSR
ncbi:hypothetical protein OTB20_10880 [Streptomyces sp. H27-H1]|uniref:hypothetical protein n=1 Tax=Streptomyces sp. H27-H1 TaxID=2996461 RepID=UPI00226E6150|nr:hypothetical protein [Streptomyces sp. H27-H1]MCY0926700.1 hypothetical protein [Streptomyces sp. H27-H1]